MTRRVVITGLGTVNPLAYGVPAFWEGLLAGRSGDGADRAVLDTAAFKVRLAGEVKNWNPEGRSRNQNRRRPPDGSLRHWSRHPGSRQGRRLDFAKEDPFRCGVILGSGIGGLSEFEEQHLRS